MSRRIALRRACGVAVAVLLAFAIACAEKAMAPEVALSPRFTIRVTTTANRTAAAQKLLVAAGYFRPPFPGDSPQDSLFVLGYSFAEITGGPQQINLNVDLTSCLADPERHGSLTACSLYILAILEPSTFDLEEHPWLGGSYDYRIAGPYDATPGHPPTVPAIDLSTSSFAVNHWEADGSLGLSALTTPQLMGPITGVASGTGPATLFALTQGFQLPAAANGDQHYGALLNIFQNGSWRRVNGPFATNPTNCCPFFNDVAAFAANDVYLSGAGRLFHYDGTAITPLPNVQDALRSLSVSSSSASGKFLIAGTTTGAVWVSNLATFTKYSIPLSSVELVCINGATEAFATSRANGSSVYRFDGTNWTSVPTASTSGKTDLQCLGPGQAYVATGGNPGTLYRWNGTGWTALTGPSGVNGRSLNWAVVSANEMYAAGDSGSVNRAFYRFDGTSWREVGRLAFTIGGGPNRIWADPRGGGAFVGTAVINSPARIEQVTPNSASVFSYTPALRDVAMPTPSSAFVVGGSFFLARWNGARWTVDAPPPGTPTTPTLNGVWADAPTNAWAVGQQSTIVRWDGTRWNVLSDTRRPIVSPNDNYNAAWGSGASVWIVGDVSMVRCSTAGSCAISPQSGGGALYGVWGTSPTNVYAVGAGGRILHFDGNSWTSMNSGTGARLSRVSGSGPNDIWAAADTVVLHFDGTAWTRSAVTIDPVYPGYQTPPVFQLGLWTASAREAYFGSWYGRILRGGGGHHWEENSWGPSFVQLLGIAGPAGGCALAVVEAGSSAAGTPNLMRGVGPTGCLAAPMSAPLSWP